MIVNFFNLGFMISIQSMILLGNINFYWYFNNSYIRTDIVCLNGHIAKFSLQLHFDRDFIVLSFLLHF